MIAAEDTRHSRRLLSELGIDAPMRSLHDHNEGRVIPELLDRLSRGENLALISDAGTPLISDPGFLLVRACHEAGVQVCPVPGPSAVVAALSAGGLSTDSFRFVGFLPRSSGARCGKLESLVRDSSTLVFYEAPHRIEAMLSDLEAVFGGQRDAVLARELTKLHETVIRAPLAELSRKVAEDPEQRLGEIVVLVAGAPDPVAGAGSEEVDELLRTLLEYLPVKQVAAAASRISGGKKNALYRRALELRRVGERED